MSYIHRDNIEIRIKLGDTKSYLARATVIFFGCIETHGWRVMESTKMHPQFGEHIWIQAPSIKAGPKWKEIVYISDRKAWELVHEMIFDAFHMARSKKEGVEGTEAVSNEKTSQSEEEVDLDDIPF